MNAPLAEPSIRLTGAALPDVQRSITLVRWLAASWVVLLIVGYSSLRTPTALAARNFVSADRGIFTTVNVATQTGFAQQFAKPDDFAPPVQWIFALQTFSGTLLSVVGGGVLLARVLKLPHTDSRIAGAGLILIAFGMAAGLLTWHTGESAQRAAFRGLAAVSCSGLAFGATPGPTSPGFVGVLAPLSVLGSFGALVLLELIDALRTRRLPAEHVRRVLELAGCLYFAATLVLTTLFKLDGQTLRSSVLRASALVISARGYGLPLEFSDQWPRGVAWALVVILLIGVGTAGAAGSLGYGWLMTLPATCWRALHRMVFWQATLLIGALLLLLQTEPQLAADRLILLVAGAGMNVGLSHEPVSITGWGLVILALVMVWGKLLPLLFLRGLLDPQPVSPHLPGPPPQRI
ncbi:MAG: hypothetical protein ACTHLZ_18985 [Tepidisphaeraceae bacterium]